MSEPERIEELAGRMKPESWRCSMCGKLDAPLVIVPKHHNVQIVEGDEGDWIPLLVKLHPGQCQEAWELYGRPTDEAGTAQGRLPGGGTVHDDRADANPCPMCKLAGFPECHGPHLSEMPPNAETRSADE